MNRTQTNIGERISGANNEDRIFVFVSRKKAAVAAYIVEFSEQC
jgi:hypothetical protein